VNKYAIRNGRVAAAWDLGATAKTRSNMKIVDTIRREDASASLAGKNLCEAVIFITPENHLYRKSKKGKPAYWRRIDL
jgi:hypothetical protein